MWEFRVFGSSFLVSHCIGIHQTLIRNKDGKYSLLIPARSFSDSTDYESNVPSVCPECREEIPEHLEIQMKLLSI